MGRPLGNHIRARIRDLGGEGLDTASIAARLGVSRRAVQVHLRPLGETSPVAIAPGPVAGTGPGARRGRPPRSDLLDLRPRAEALLEQHPRWGAGIIWACLARQFPDRPLPSPRCLQRWLAPLRQQPALTRPAKANRYARATIPHQTWQMDAADQMALASGGWLSWLRVADECSGAVLQTLVFPYKHFNQVPEADLQQGMRGLFARWGLPEELRVDNGAPWGGWSDLPAPWSLWLIGLGIEVVWNPPYRPQYNGVVERSHQSAQGWEEVGRCTSVAQVQQEMDEVDELQRRYYPHKGGLSRWELFPKLAEVPRPYSPRWEEGNWDHQRVLDHLACYTAVRQADKGGKVSVYNRNLHVGVAQAGQEVRLSLDPLCREWVAQDESGTQVRRIPAAELTADAIRLLQVKGPK